MGNDRMEETTPLDFNMDKSCFIVIGNRKVKQDMQDKLALNPPTLYGKLMKQVEN